MNFVENRKCKMLACFFYEIKIMHFIEGAGRRIDSFLRFSVSPATNSKHMCLYQLLETWETCLKSLSLFSRNINKTRCSPTKRKENLAASALVFNSNYLYQLGDVVKRSSKTTK